MRRKTYRIMAIMATVLLAFATCGCVDPLDDSLKPQPEEPTLTFWIKAPGTMQAATKAQTGEVSGIEKESSLHDVLVWVFDHSKTDGSTLPLNYVDKDIVDTWDNHTTTSNMTPDEKWAAAYKIQVPISKEFILSNNPRVDIYVLANWRSIFTTKPSQMTLAGVRDLVFGDATKTNAYFGTTPTSAVPNEGLPISAVYKGTAGNGVDLSFLKQAYNGEITLTNDVFKSRIGVIELERAVAKVRFVFAKTTGLYGEITKIEIYNTAQDVTEGLIPDRTYAFPRYVLPGADYIFALPTGASYGNATTTTTLPGVTSANIVEVTDPVVLRSDYNEIPQGATVAPINMEAQDYDTYLTNNTSAVKATTAQLVYFRESDKMISGKIYFKKTAGGQEESKPFVMTPVDKNDKYTNLYRNHYWTVYAYFLDGDLYVKPTVAPWVDTPELDYTLKMNTNMRLFDSWLYRYDTDGDYTDYTKWATSHMAVSDGKVETSATETITGRPLRSPQIQLVTTGVGATNSSFQLTVDNNNFQLVKVVKKNSENVVVTDGTGIVKEYEYSDVINITGDENVYTYFYIVPKPGVTWVDDEPNTWLDDDPDNDVRTNRVAKVSLIYNDPFTGPQKVTFNYSALPGYSDDSSEIWAYYFPADEYNISGKLKMYYKDSNNPLVPTPVQN